MCKNSKSITLDELVMSRSFELIKRVEKISSEQENEILQKKEVLDELNFFLAYLGNETLPDEKKNPELKNIISKPKLILYALDYLNNLEADLGELNV